MKIVVNKIVELCNGKLLCGDGNVILKKLVIDTRMLEYGDTFVGIKGENYNGNDFLYDAVEKGANCVILDENKDITDIRIPVILVSDSSKALGIIASYIRNNSDSIFIGVTGSVGKTSTRDMIYSVLNESHPTLKTENNYNNNIGLPLTISKLCDERFAVIEMGMNHLGEISYLSNIVKPNIGVITNVGTAHIGILGSRENILKAKLEILDGMDDSSTLIINNDNDLLHDYYLNNDNKKNIITIGIDNDSDYKAININENDNNSEFDVVFKNQTIHILCPIPGRAYIYNSLCAIAVGSILSIDNNKIIDGIKNIHLTKNRLEFINLKNDIKIINGIYNASVDSMKASIDVLKNQTCNRKIAVLGDMLELGCYSKDLHQGIGRFVYENNIDVLITVGRDSSYISSEAIKCGMNKDNVYILSNNNDAISILNNIMLPGDAILLKASNGLHFKEILNEIIKGS